MKKELIRLTEQDLQNIIKESVTKILQEENIEEGWFGDKWNQVKTAYNTATQDGGNGLTLKDRYNRTKNNWQTQGQLNDLSNLRKQLEAFVDSGKINPQMTISQLIGGKYNGNKFGKLSGMIGNRQSQINRNGGQYNE